jgi:hypothetical protein
LTAVHSDRRIRNRSRRASLYGISHCCQRTESPRSHHSGLDVARRVHQEFDEQLDATVVNASLERVSAMFTDAKIRGFAPLLVRRYVNDELQKRVEQA